MNDKDLDKIIKECLDDDRTKDSIKNCARQAAVQAFAECVKAAYSQHAHKELIKSIAALDDFY